VDGVRNEDEVFRALADGSRRHLLDALHRRNGQTLVELCEGLSRSGVAMSRQAVSKHLGILEEARLVLTLRKGREKRHFLNPGPIADIAGRWIGKYESARVEALAQMKKQLEESS
jgi:DNA-binding transcriptional ArsR family regulator